MPTTTTTSNSASAGAPSNDFCAVILLDSAGVITGRNASARELWPAHRLVGEAFVSLFAFEITSSDPDFLEAQWEGLLVGALNRTTTLTLQPAAGHTERAVRVRLEPFDGVPAGYTATILPPAVAPATVASSGADEATAAVRLLTEKGAAGFFDLNLKAGQVRLSAAWKKILGYAAPELPDTIETWRTLIHPDDSAAAPDKVGRKIPAGPRPISVEFRMKHRRGHWVWIQCIGLQLVGAPGEVERVVGLHLDISERKELEDILVANDARLQDLSGAGPLAAFELDFANSTFWFSPAWEKLLGYDEGELAATVDSFAAALPPEEAAAGVTEWLLGRAPGQVTWLEAVRLRAKDGKPLRVILGACRSVTRKRELVRVVGFACPLPAGAAADEGALPAILVDEAFRALAEGVLITDARGKVIYANTVATRLLQSNLAALRGQLLGDVFRLINRQSGRPSDDPVEAALSAVEPLGLISTDALAAAVEAEAPIPVVWTARKADGPDGKTHGIVVVFRNPDEMSLTREELIKADKFEQLGFLAGRIAHDYNNHLTTIIGAISRTRNSRDYSALDDAETSCNAAQQLSRHLLSASRGGAGTQVVCRPVDIFEDAKKIAAAGSSAAIATEVADGVENVLVDRSQILQVFQNLIVNALQAMPPPPHRPRMRLQARNVTLADQQVQGLAAGDYVEFEVSDNGSGIKPEHLEKIFDPFFTTKKHGTGLGLATVLIVVRKHGGQILVATEVGVGTAFTVFLPKAEKPFERTRSIPALSYRSGRILFMDDDPKISALTAAMLTSLEYTCDLARNGDEAIELYRKNHVSLGRLSHGRRYYDAVIMDLTVVGGMGGEECFNELRKLDPDVRAIVASGYDNDDIAREFLEKGFLGYLTKPYREKDLGKVLKDVLG